MQRIDISEGERNGKERKGEEVRCKAGGGRRPLERVV
jgi:hypothetical protein